MKVEEFSASIPGAGAASATAFPKVATISFFRQCRKDVDAFFARRDRLTYPQDRMQHFCIESDSDDGTFEALKEHTSRRKNWVVRKKDFNFPYIRAFPHPGRQRQQAKSANFSVQTLLKECDAEYVLWIESDLDYPPDLIERLVRHEKDFVAPMVLVEGTKNFYDTFAFRRGADAALVGPTGDPGCFQGEYPYHPAYRENGLFELDGAGSCLFFRMDVLRKGAYFTDHELIVGFCRTAREAGIQIWGDPSTIVYHPVPDHVLEQKKFTPWEDTKVLMKYQEKVPVDLAAGELGKRYKFPFAKPLEFAWIAKRMSKERGAKTLDAHSDVSTFAVYCGALGLDAVATDDPDLEPMHRRVFEACGEIYRFVKSDRLSLPFPDGHFDQVVCIESLAYTKKDREAALELARVCKPGGRIFLALPYDHYTFWWDNCGTGKGARYYYDLQAVMDRIVNPLGAIIRDFSFIRYEFPSEQKDPTFTHPNNSGAMVLELETRS